MEASMASASLECKQSTIMEGMSQVHDLLCQLRAIVLPSAPAGPPSELARDLFKDIFGSFNTVLSHLQSIPRWQGPDPDDCCDRSKRRKVDSWTVTTTVPHNDGHQWRKYGQKPINSSKFPRSYYKCAYSRDHGCSATKTVQQRHGNHNPPKFLVTYSVRHTCKLAATSPADKDSSGKKTSSIEKKIVEPDAGVHGRADCSPAGSTAAEVQDQRDSSPASSAVLTEPEIDELPSLEPVTNIPNIFSPSVLDGDFWSNVDDILGTESGYCFDEFTLL